MRRSWQASHPPFGSSFPRRTHGTVTSPAWELARSLFQANLPVLGVRSCNQCVPQADSPQRQDLAKKAGLALTALAVCEH